MLMLKISGSFPAMIMMGNLGMGFVGTAGKPCLRGFD